MVGVLAYVYFREESKGMRRSVERVWYRTLGHSVGVCQVRRYKQASPCKMPAHAKQE